MNKKSMNIFILRLVLITHLALTLKLPIEYLKLFTQPIYRALLGISLILLSYIDLVSCLLLGMILVFSNYEFLQREKILGN